MTLVESSVFAKFSPPPFVDDSSLAFVDASSLAFVDDYGSSLVVADVSDDSLPSLGEVSLYQAWTQRDVMAHTVSPLYCPLWSMHMNVFLLGLLLGCVFAWRFARNDPPTAIDPVKGVSV